MQQQYAREKGASENLRCACAGAGEEDPGYAAFGIAALSLKPQACDSLVIAPYAAMLALMFEPASALKNLEADGGIRLVGPVWLLRSHRLASAQGAEVVRSWMAHHEGMALLAICNLLFDNPIQNYFHAEPQVLATELLLNERLPASVTAEAEFQPFILPALPEPG